MAPGESRHFLSFFPVPPVAKSREEGLGILRREVSTRTNGYVYQLCAWAAASPNNLNGKNSLLRAIECSAGSI